MQEEFAMILKLTFDTNTIYTVIYWAKIVFSLCLQRDLYRWMKGWELLPILQDSVPYQGRCHATLLYLTNIKEQGKGTPDL